MRFRGFLTCRSFKILAWLFIIFAQIKAIAEIKTALDIKPINSEITLDIFAGLSSIAMPLLLISCLSIILNGKDSYKKMLIRNGAITIGFFLIGIFVYERYVLGLLDIFTGNRKEAAEMARVILTIGENHESVGFVTFNIFVDIFLCTLVMFFLNYQPKDHFRGKNIYIFRGMVLIPVIYEVGNIVLKYLAVKQKVTIPLFVMPFLTTKSPLIMVLFVALAAYIKKRERLFIRHGKSYEDYQEFLKSNTNAFQFFSFVLNTIEPGITSYTDALWYCFAIITTIGFGDVTATTGIGRMLSVILGIYGIIVVALITSIIVNFYTEVKNDDEK